MINFSAIRRLGMDKKRQEKTQVECPRCGYRMPVFYDPDAECKGIHVACKGRHCKHVFEVNIKQGKQQFK